LKLINGTIEYLKVQRECTKFGAVGFSAGAAWVLNLLSEDPSFEHIDAGFIAHPAGVTTQMLEGVQGPLSIACADEDQIQTRKNRIEAEDILKKNGWPYQVNLYSHVHHGFAVRRAVTTKAEVYSKKQAFVQAVSWFEEHFFNGE
jgi:dienelactone hydrolase